MAALPSLPYNLRWDSGDMVAMRGINWSDAITAGDMADSVGISTRRWPYISTRRAREQKTVYQGCTALTAWNKLVAVCGSTLLYDGKAVGNVLPGQKQFAVVNTKLCIFPDKKFLDLNTMQIGSLSAAASGGTMTFTTDTVSVTGWGVDFAAYFNVGDAVTITGCNVHPENNKTFIIRALTADSITGDDNTFTAGTETAAVVGDEFADVVEMNTSSRSLTAYPYLVVQDGELVLQGEAVSVTKETAGKYAGYFFEADGDIFRLNRLSIMADADTEGATAVEGGYVKLGSVGSESRSGSAYQLHVYPDIKITDGELAFYGEPETITVNHGYTPETPVFIDLSPRHETGDYASVVSATINKLEYRRASFAANTVYTWYVSPMSVPGEGESGVLTIERRVPHMDFICEKDNRLWGCSNADKTIYASALGDPTNFFIYQGLSTDSYAVAVGSEGEFTGCCKLSSSVLFWKENKLHKMLGSYPAEYAMYAYDVEGVKAGCHRSMAVINERLFYLGLRGVYTFAGGTPSLLSPNFGQVRLSGGVAGTDGKNYYLSAFRGDNPVLLVYDTVNGIWTKEDELACRDFARAGDALFFADANGDVWLEDSGRDGQDVDWYVQFTPFYETIEARKTFARLLIRLEAAAGSRVEVKTRFNGGTWMKVGSVRGDKSDVVTMPVFLNRCDKYEIRIEGKGPCTILEMLRQFRVGGAG